MTHGGRNQRRHQAHQVVVHITGVSDGAGGGTHDSGDEHVGGVEAVDVALVVLRLEILGGDSFQGSVVEDHDGVTIQGESFQSQERVVGLHYHVASDYLVGKHGIVGHQFLGVLVRYLL